MMPARLRLKHSTGWFAAGREVAAALEILSDAAFKLYLYLCLNADRPTGRMVCRPAELARALQRRSENVIALLEELRRREVCALEDGSDRLTVEIRDRFWPYERSPARELVIDQRSYVDQARHMLLRPACVRASFSAADEKLAVSLYRRGVTLAQLEQAIWLGCARKYIALLNGQTPMLVTSLQYFSAIVDEVITSTVGDSYWTHVRQQAEHLERRWTESRRRASLAAQQDEMTETK